MSVKRKCKWCEKTTIMPLSDFADYVKGNNGWSAYSVGKEVAICACPKHGHLLKKEMEDRLANLLPSIKGQQLDVHK